MKLHDRLYRYFTTRMRGEIGAQTTNLSGIRGGGDWLERHLDVGMALASLRRDNPSAWRAVMLRWHFLIAADAVERKLGRILEDLRIARRQNNGRQITAARRCEALSGRRLEKLQDFRRGEEEKPAYQQGMDYIRARLSRR